LAAGWQRTEIPFAALRSAGRARMPRWMNLAGHEMLALSYEAAGRTRRLFFLPGEVAFLSPTNHSAATAEWLKAIGGAAEAATGQKLTGNLDSPEIVPVSPWGASLMFAPMVFALAMFSFLLMADHGPGPLVFFLPILMVFIGCVAAMASLQRRRFSGPLYPPAPGSPKRSAVPLVLAGSLILFLCLGAAVAFYPHLTADRFGPEHEFMLLQPAPDVPSVLNFGDDRGLTPPDDLANKLAAGTIDLGLEDRQWLRTAGGDAALNASSPGTLRLFEGFCFEIHGGTTFDNITPALVVASMTRLWSGRPGPLREPEMFSATPAGPSGVVAFVTREGALGVLEIVGATKDPHPLLIRYKLVHPGTIPSANWRDSGTGLPRRFEPAAAVTGQSAIPASAGPVAVAPIAPAIAVPSPAFGPVIERTLPIDKNVTPLLDLETNEIKPDPKPDDMKAGLAAMFSSGVGIIHDEALGQTELLGLASSMTPVVGADQWDRMSAGEAVAAAGHVVGKPGVIQAAVVAGQPPFTFLVKTGAGKVALFRVDAFTADPAGVKIRYKLVQAPAAP
jgi:hypothetical protein